MVSSNDRWNTINSMTKYLGSSTEEGTVGEGWGQVWNDTRENGDFSRVVTRKGQKHQSWENCVSP